MGDNDGIRVIKVNVNLPIKMAGDGIEWVINQMIWASIKSSDRC